MRKSLEKLSLPAPHGLHGLLVLLEKSPEELLAWVNDPAVPLGDKARVLAVLEEDVPGTLIPVLPAFIGTAHPLFERAMPQARMREAENYCERLFSLLLLDKDRFLPALQQEAREMLRSVARNLMAATFPVSSLWAVAMLEAVGSPRMQRLSRRTVRMTQALQRTLTRLPRLCAASGRDDDKEKPGYCSKGFNSCSSSVSWKGFSRTVLDIRPAKSTDAGVNAPPVMKIIRRDCSGTRWESSSWSCLPVMSVIIRSQRMAS